MNKDKIGLIVPVRYNSERFPGKVLAKVNGKPALEILIERALKSNYIDKVILAVSEESSKEIVECWFKYIQHNYLNVYLFIGEHNNIGKRTLQAALQCNIDIIVDTSQDCICIDPVLIDELIDNLYKYDCDYSSNIIVRSYPDGLDLQVYRTSLYKQIIESGFAKPEYTGWNIFYCREKIFPKPRFFNLMSPAYHYFPEWHVCLDTKEDYELLQIIFSGLGFDFNHRLLIQYLKAHPELLKINKSVIPTELEQELI